MPEPRKIRVLIVDDIAETRENIIRSLQFDSQIQVVGSAKSGREGIQMSKELKPDVIIMDINMPDMDGITVTENIRKALPTSQIVILSVQGDASYMRKAMLVGARDFLTKPPSIDELTSTIHRAGELSIEQQEKAAIEAERRSVSGNGKGGGNAETGKIVVVYSPKGGVGTTTLATNLAIGLLNGDKKVLLVDSNIQFGDVAIFLNVQAKNSIAEIAPRAEDLDEEVVRNVVTLHPSSGLNVLPAPPNPEDAENINSEQIAKALQFMRSIYDYVVVDTNSYLSEVVQSSLAVADIIILVTSQDIPSIKNNSLFLSLADATGIDRNRILFVMNQFDRRIGITPERVSENLKHEIILTIPNDERLMVNASINKGVPLIMDNKNHPISKGIGVLTNRIQERILQFKESK
jgi:pilus assembly protein CpaE